MIGFGIVLFGLILSIAADREIPSPDSGCASFKSNVPKTRAYCPTAWYASHVGGTTYATAVYLESATDHRGRSVVREAAARSSMPDAFRVPLGCTVSPPPPMVCVRAPVRFNVPPPATF
jgi:hypothetical protein